MLLVIQNGVKQDKTLKASVEKLEKRNDTTVFVTDVKDVADYSRVAEGVQLDRAPAMIVVAPKKRTLAGSLPTATVSYGFRRPESVEQAVRESLYNGRQLSYDPG